MEGRRNWGGVIHQDNLKKLFKSFEQLERSINLAKHAINSWGANVPASTLKRLSHYEDVLGKQKKLAQLLDHHIALQNWGEVQRNVNLINALLAVIQKEAGEFFGELLGEINPPLLKVA